MALFAKAASKTKEATKTVKRGTPWLVGDPAGDAIASSIHQLCVLEGEAKAIAAKMDVHKTVCKKAAFDRFLSEFAARKMPPDTPMFLQNADGEKVTYVVQDRSGSASVKDEQLDSLRELFGEDKAKELVYEETTFGFNRDVLALPGVQDAIEKALESALKKLDLSDEVKEALLTVEKKTSFKPGTLERMAQICGSDTQLMRQFLEVMGSACVRYIK